MPFLQLPQHTARPPTMARYQTQRRADRLFFFFLTGRRRRKNPVPTGSSPPPPLTGCTGRDRFFPGRWPRHASLLPLLAPSPPAIGRAYLSGDETDHLPRRIISPDRKSCTLLSSPVWPMRTCSFFFWHSPPFARIRLCVTARVDDVCWRTFAERRTFFSSFFLRQKAEAISFYSQFFLRTNVSRHCGLVLLAITSQRSVAPVRVSLVPSLDGQNPGHLAAPAVRFSHEGGCGDLPSSRPYPDRSRCRRKKCIRECAFSFLPPPTSGVE